jgi:hypothetical protein
MRVPNVMHVSPTLPVKTVPEFIAYAKVNLRFVEALHVSTRSAAAIAPASCAIGGFLCAQGRAASNAAAARMMSVSWSAFEMICNPTGRPARVNPHGTEAAGRPHRLTG